LCTILTHAAPEEFDVYRQFAHDTAVRIGVVYFSIHATSQLTLFEETALCRALNALGGCFPAEIALVWAEHLPGANESTSLDAYSCTVALGGVPKLKQARVLRNWCRVASHASDAVAKEVLRASNTIEWTAKARLKCAVHLATSISEALSDVLAPARISHMLSVLMAVVWDIPRNSDHEFAYAWRFKNVRCRDALNEVCASASKEHTEEFLELWFQIVSLCQSLECLSLAAFQEFALQLAAGVQMVLANSLDDILQQRLRGSLGIFASAIFSATI
jgi:hypothetical protein